MSENLFHYTDVGAVKAILEERKLRLTDIRFLNDSQELKDGVAHILAALESYFPDHHMNGSYIERAQEVLKSVMKDHVPRYVDIEPTFVCSFSKAGNQLSQWRAYGSYAIEFDREVIEEELALFDCIYTDAKKLDEASSMVSDAVYSVASELQEYDAFGPVSVRYASMLVRTASTFKDLSFYEEQEVRCAIDVLLPDKRVEFRPRGGMLVPYIVQKFPINAVKAIHIGPMSDQNLAAVAMKAFVRSVESKILSAGGSIDRQIEIVESQIPYRSN